MKSTSRFVTSAIVLSLVWVTADGSSILSESWKEKQKTGNIQLLNRTRSLTSLNDQSLYIASKADSNFGDIGLFSVGNSMLKGDIPQRSGGFNARGSMSDGYGGGGARGHGREYGGGNTG